MSQPVKHPEQGRFAGSAFSDQDQGFTLNHFEIDVLKDSNTRAELLAHVADTQDGWVHRYYRTCVKISSAHNSLFRGREPAPDSIRGLECGGFPLLCKEERGEVESEEVV